MNKFDPPKKHLTIPCKNYTKKKKLQKFKSKKHLTLPYKKKKLCQEKKRRFQNKKAPSTTLQKLYKEKKMHNFESKKHLTLPYKHYTKKKIAEIQAKKAPNTTFQKLCKEKKNA